MQPARCFVGASAGVGGVISGHGSRCCMMLVRRVIVNRRLRHDDGRHAIVPRTAGQHGRSGQPLQRQRHRNQPHHCGSENSPHAEQCMAIDCPHTMARKAALGAGTNRYGTGGLEKFLRVMSVVTMLMTVPQVLAVWLSRDAAGVSVLSWGAYLFSACLWFVYGWRASATRRSTWRASAGSCSTPRSSSAPWCGAERVLSAAADAVRKTRSRSDVPRLACAATRPRAGRRRSPRRPARRRRTPARWPARCRRSCR